MPEAAWLPVELPIPYLALLAGLLLVLLFLQRRRRPPEVPSADEEPEAAPHLPARPDHTTAPPQSAVHTPAEHADELLQEDSHASASIDVVEVDPLEEASIYLRFGYYDKAAEVLRWHADQGGPAQIQLLRLLMHAYMQAKRVDDFADTLERVLELSTPDDSLKNCLIQAMKREPEHLHLRVLALSHFKLGVQDVNRLIGFEPAPLPQEPNAETRPAPTITTPAPALSPARTAPPAPTTTRRLFPLLKGEADFGPALSAEEKETLRAFAPPARAAKVHLLCHDHPEAIDALQRAITREPKALVHFTDLLKLHQSSRDAAAYARTLWQLYATLGNAGQALRERMLATGFRLGHHAVFEALAQAKDSGQIEGIGRRFGYTQPESPPRRKLPLVEPLVVAGQRPSAAVQDDVLNEVDAYLEFGQIEPALDLLEKAILADTTAVHLYPTLLDLYDRMDDLERFTAFSDKVKQEVMRPPEEVVAMMSSLYQRLKDRTEKIAA